MIIHWYGEGCFKIQSGEHAILTDPFNSTIGLAPPRIKPDFTLKTLVSTEAISSHLPSEIIGPGEYHFSYCNILGFPAAPLTETKNIASKGALATIYVLEVESLRLCLFFLRQSQG